DRIAFRKIRLRPMACSRPGGHGATISHASPTTSTRTTKVQIGWRVLRFCKVPMLPAVATCLFDKKVLPAAPVVSNSLMISPIWTPWKQFMVHWSRRSAHCAESCWDAVDDEQRREACLTGKAKSSPIAATAFRAASERIQIASEIRYSATPLVRPIGAEADASEGAMEHGHGFTHCPPIGILCCCLARTILHWAWVASGRGWRVKNVLNRWQRLVSSPTTRSRHARGPRSSRGPKNRGTNSGAVGCFAAV